MSLYVVICYGPRTAEAQLRAREGNGWQDRVAYVYRRNVVTGEWERVQ